MSSIQTVEVKLVGSPSKGHHRTDSSDSNVSAALTERADDDHPAAQSCRSLHSEKRHEIFGVGRTFNRSVGQLTNGCLRTGCSIHVDSDLATTAATLRANIIEQAADPECCVRLMVQEAEYWFTAAPAERVADSLVFVAGHEREAYERRRADARDDAVPASVCILESLAGSDGRQTLATWLFRHDVLDGWRCLRYLTSLLFLHTDLTVARLRARHEEAMRANPPGLVRRALGLAASTAGAALLAPLAAYRLAQLTREPAPRADLTDKFYLHATVSVKALKALGKAERLGSLTNTLTCAIAAAYFAAEPTEERATIASNVLFEPDCPSGNHVCLKVASVSVPAAAEGAAEGPAAAAAARAHQALHATGRTLQAASQRLSDTVLALASRKYVLGETPERWNAAIEARQQGLDLLVSNLPAFDACSPGVLDLQVARDYDNWAPSIVYAIGVEDSIFLDFYFGVRPSFDRETFVQTFCGLGVGATNVHTRLPDCY